MKKKIYITSVTVLAILVFLYAQNRWLIVTTYEVTSEKIPEAFDQFTVVHLTDLHNTEFSKDNSALIKKIETANPDIVVVTGDVKVGKAEGEVFLELAGNLSGDYPVYYTSGNHEERYYRDVDASEKTRYEQQLTDNGVTVLNNKKVELHKKEAAINLYGLRDDYSFYENKSENTPFPLKKKMGSAKQEAFNFVLSHRPDRFHEFAHWGADLTLSGHTHGGVVYIPFTGGLLKPMGGFFPEYDRGRFDYQNSSLIVGRGLGGSGFEQRIFNRPEIVVITLHHAS